jgi:hypothetical protein
VTLVTAFLPKGPTILPGIRIISACCALAGVVASAAYGAYICHPDPPGTRALSFDGTIGSYSFNGATVSLFLDWDGACERVRWSPTTGVLTRRTAPKAACKSGGGLSSRSVDGGRVATLEEGNRVSIRKPGGGRSTTIVLGAARTVTGIRLSGDRLLAVLGPDATHDLAPRLDVYSVVSRRRIRSWPLFANPSSLDVAGGIAVFATSPSQGLYAVRLDDGRTALVGVNRRRDTPQIEQTGLVFQDNLYKAQRRPDRTILKFIPREAVDAAVADVGKPLRTNGRIEALAMDGPRVAVAVAGGRLCDRIVYWNIPWRYAARITDDDAPTCRRPGPVISLSLGGLRAVWAKRSGGTTMVLGASSVDCVENLVSRGPARTRGGTSEAVTAGDGAVLAYAQTRTNGSVLGIVAGDMHGVPIATGGYEIREVAVDADLIAARRDDGVVDIRRADGALLQSIRRANARAIALRATKLAVLTRDGTLDVYDVATGIRERRWRVPTGVRPTLDLHHGIAVLATARTVVAIRIADGRRARLATSDGLGGAQIESPGAAYWANHGGRGVVKFIPFAAIEAMLR